MAELSRQEARVEIERQLRELALDGGQRRVTYRCEHCGRDGSKTIQSIDPELQLKVLKALQDLERDERGPGGSNESAAAVLAKVAELTDDELAAEIARLRALA